MVLTKPNAFTQTSIHVKVSTSDVQIISTHYSLIWQVDICPCLFLQLYTADPTTYTHEPQQTTSQATNNAHKRTKRGTKEVPRALTDRTNTSTSLRVHVCRGAEQHQKLNDRTLSSTGRGRERPSTSDRTPSHVKLALHEADAVLHVSRYRGHTSTAQLASDLSLDAPDSAPSLSLAGRRRLSL